MSRGPRRARCACWPRERVAEEDGPRGGAARRRPKNSGECVHAIETEREGERRSGGFLTLLRSSGSSPRRRRGHDDGERRGQIDLGRRLWRRRDQSTGWQRRCPRAPREACGVRQPSYRGGEPRGARVGPAPKEAAAALPSPKQTEVGDDRWVPLAGPTRQRQQVGEGSARPRGCWAAARLGWAAVLGQGPSGGGARGLKQWQARAGLQARSGLKERKGKKKKEKDFSFYLKEFETNLFDPNINQNLI